MAAADLLRHPQSFPVHEMRDAYALELLQLALNKADSDLQLTPSIQYMEQNRTLTELELNRSVDVVWSMASAEREARMLPIRIGILLAATTPLERNQLWQTPEQLHKLSNSKPH